MHSTIGSKRILSALVVCQAAPCYPAFFSFANNFWVAHALGSKANGGTPQRMVFCDQGKQFWKSTSVVEPIEKDIKPAGLDA